MGIAYDSGTNGGGTTGTSLNFNHTCSGANRALLVAVGTNVADNTDYITGVTYNSVSMTKVDSFRSPGAGGHELYYLSNPSSGTNQVSVSLSSSVAVYAASTSYTGVKQTGQPHKNNGNASDPVDSLTVNVTTTTDNCWLVSSACKKATTGYTISAGTNTTSRIESTDDFVGLGDSNGAESPAGEYGQTWQISTTSGLAVITLALEPAPQTGIISIL